MASELWRYRIGGLDFGPVDFEQLSALAEGGQLSADDEVSADDGKWMRAGEIVGLIPDSVSGEFAFALPDLSRDRRQSGVSGGSPRSSTESATSADEPNVMASTPISVSASAAKAEMQSLLDQAETVRDSARSGSAQERSQGNVSPQRGITLRGRAGELAGQPSPSPAKIQATGLSDRAATPTGEGSANLPEDAITETDSSRTTASHRQFGDAETQSAVSRPAAAFPPSAAARNHPSFPKSNRRSASVIGGETVAKVGGALALVVVLGWGASLGFGMLSGSRAVAANAIVKETDSIVRQLMSLAESFDTGSRPDRFVDRIGAQAKVLQERIEQQSRWELQEELLAFHRETLSRVLNPNGWTDENLAVVSSRWQEIRSLAAG